MRYVIIIRDGLASELSKPGRRFPLDYLNPKHRHITWATRETAIVYVCNK